MKIALVHDYLTEYGGAERVLEAIHELWPEAPVFTSLYDPQKLGSLIGLSASHIHSLACGLGLSAPLFGDPYPKRVRLPALRPVLARILARLRPYLLRKSFTFFMPLVFENFDLRDYDVIISDGTIWSKGVLTDPEQLFIFYCHTPPRWLWGLPGETDRRRLWYLEPILKPLDNWLRIWDFESAQRPDFIIANSKTTAARIRKFWRREAAVIYPPVSLASENRNNSENSVGQKIGRSEDQISPEDQSFGMSGLSGILTHRRTDTLSHSEFSENYFLVVSRLSAYKNVDLAIGACNELKLPLKIVGTGREEERLRRLAGPTVEFLGFVEDSKLSELYRNCKALIHPVSDEDFGIVPVEAMIFGKPVIALRSGGVTETVIEGKTGVFFDEPTVESLVGVLKDFDDSNYQREDCIRQAQKFSKERFQKEFKAFVEEKLQEFRNSARIKLS